MNDVSEASIPVADQKRNGLVFMIATSLIYLIAPVTYVGVLHATILDSLKASNRVANLPEAVYLLVTPLPVLIAWFWPSPQLLRPMLTWALIVKGAGGATAALVFAFAPKTFWIPVLIIHLAIIGIAEGYAVTDRQYDEIVTAFADEMRQGKAEPIVGVIDLSMATIVDRIKQARDLDVRQYQISLTSWAALSEKELFSFFQHVCGSFPDCQFIHYNLSRTKRMVTGKEYARLAAEHPNLVATKNCGDSQSHLRSLIEDSPQLQHFLSEAGYVYGSLFGEWASWHRLL